MISIKINSQPVDDMLNHLIQQSLNMSQVMEAIGMEFESRVSARFETQTDPNGIPWAPLKSSTIKSYPKDGNRKLLDRYGDMLSSITHQSDSNSVVIGFGQPYAEFHETSTTNMVRRGTLTNGSGSIGDDDARSVLKLLNEYFARG